MKKPEFSVLMSIYKNEKREYFKEAIESIYEKQTLKPQEIVLIKDGPLTEELEEELNFQKNKLGEILRVIPLERNVGLGKALEIGVNECKYPLIARMDTDDIAFEDRFEKQISYLIEHPDIDILGSDLYEFKNNISNIISLKKVPTEDIENYIRYRSPLNHPTVIFYKESVLKSGNYKPLHFSEDIYLWGRMLKAGCKIANIPEPLLYFRISDDVYKRRGGWKYLKAEVALQKEFLRLGITTRKDFIVNVVGKGIIRLLPNCMRKIIYMKLLRK